MAMDKGAHFHKCDFQVHSPRDANWDGAEAATATERQAYASELVRACRERGLASIAMTDHHDFTFFPFVRAAAQAEVDQNGEAIPKERRLVVYPGLELTLSSPPCQAILLLDADFDATKLQDVLTALAITPTDPVASKLATVESVSPATITGLNDLEDRLSQHPWLKGKFVILPNVTTKGYKTLFRDGFDKHYKEMRCVGGYVDGSYADSSVGKKNILEGRQQNNGYKPIAVFQTSDNRRRDHLDLGKHSTYVKWSEPTTEAIRQACLARESRISHDTPTLPAMWITTVTVSNCKFLGRLDLELNQQYNALIGGRGTGKSTILEYVRWGLCDQPVEGDELDSVQKKRKNLIENTLSNFDGQVIVEFLLNGVPHIVKRNAKSQEISLKIGERDFAPATEQQVRSLMPIQAYSQKQLSGVGVRVAELRRFVELPIRQELEQIKSELRDAEAKMRSSYGKLIRQTEIQEEIAKNDVELKSLGEQLDGLRRGLTGLSEDDQKTIQLKAKYDAEKEAIEALGNQMTTAEERVILLDDALPQDLSESTERPTFENKTALKLIYQRYYAKFAEIRAASAALRRVFGEKSVKDIDEAVEEWKKLKGAFDEKYEAAKANAQVNQQQLDQIQALETRATELKKQQAEGRKKLTELGKPKDEYEAQRGRWNTLHERKVSALEKQCGQFTALSSQMIKAEIAEGLDIVRLGQRIKLALSGMNIREEKIEKICELVRKSKTPFKDWNVVLAELEGLALHSPESQAMLPNTPTLLHCGFIESERSRIAAQLDPQRWIELSVSELEFNPTFRYCTSQKKAEYIAFADASAGQQATALLTALLNQSGAPLIIDQPEDDIDSKLFKEIVHQVWAAKGKRQLVFASHSANFVVNGDADLVICCDYVKAGDQTQGAVKAAGAIDKESIREEIILVTEGGRDAFKLRMDQYGF